jgi:hypothetical protein
MHRQELFAPETREQLRSKTPNFGRLKLMRELVRCLGLSPSICESPVGEPEGHGLSKGATGEQKPSISCVHSPRKSQKSKADHSLD